MHDHESLAGLREWRGGRGGGGARRDKGRGGAARADWARGGQRRRGDRRRAYDARGNAHMSAEALALIAHELDKAAAPCVTASFQADCVVLVHMLRQCRPDIPVLFLDTVHHFDETYRYRDRIAAAWNLNLITLRAAEPSPGLWRESTQAGSGLHKVEPLFAALRSYDT